MVPGMSGGYSASASSAASGSFGDQSTRSGVFEIGGLNMGVGGGQNEIFLWAAIALVAYLLLKK